MPSHGRNGLRQPLWQVRQFPFDLPNLSLKAVIQLGFDRDAACSALLYLLVCIPLDRLQCVLAGPLCFAQIDHLGTV